MAETAAGDSYLNSNIEMPEGSRREEEELWAAERAVMIKEFAKFLDADVPELQRQALGFLEAAVHRLRCVSVEVDDKGEAILADRASMIFLESADREVSDLDINLRIPKYNKGSSAHFSIQPKTHYLVRQIQDALHHAEMGSDEVLRLRRSGDGAHQKAEGMHELAKAVARTSQACEAVGMCIQHAQRHLSDWRTRVLPAMPQNTIRMNPPLPPDMILQIFCDASHMVMRVYMIVVHARTPLNKPQAVMGLPCSKLKGSIMQHKQKWIEVMEAIEARAEVPDLRHALADLANAQRVIDSVGDCCEALLAAAAPGLSLTGKDGLCVDRLCSTQKHQHTEAEVSAALCTRALSNPGGVNLLHE